MTQKMTYTRPKGIWLSTFAAPFKNTVRGAYPVAKGHLIKHFAAPFQNRVRGPYPGPNESCYVLLGSSLNIELNGELIGTDKFIHFLLFKNSFSLNTNIGKKRLISLTFDVWIVNWIITIIMDQSSILVSECSQMMNSLKISHLKTAKPSILIELQRLLHHVCKHW